MQNLYSVDYDPKVHAFSWLSERVHKRNNEKGPTFSFDVSDEMFDFVETMFVPPTEEELEDGLIIQ